MDEKEYDLKNLEEKLKNLENFINDSTQNFVDQKNLLSTLRNALNVAPICIWEWSIVDDRVVLDGQISRILDKDLDPVQQGWAEIISEVDIDQIQSEGKQCLKKSGYTSNLRLRGTGGKEKACELLWSAAAISGNRLTGTLIRLPSDNAHTTPNLLKQNLPIGILVLDQGGKVLNVNPAVKSILGVGNDQDILGIQLGDFKPFKEAGIVHYFHDLTEKDLDFDFESPVLQNLAGKNIYLQIRGFERNDSGQQIILITDITKRKQLEDQYRQLQRLESIGKLAGGIAHDFNNILTIIKGSTALVISGVEEGNPVYDNLYNIQRAAERAESLTHQLLAFSRRQMLQPKVLNLNELIDRMRARIENLLGGQIRLQTGFDARTGSVKADQEQIENVMINLVLNARDAMPDGGSLIIETSPVTLDENYMRGRPLVKPGPYVLLSVSDTGQGMDNSIQAHIFEPFFTTKEKGHGSGMGLATVYGVVKQSSGYIWVYSEPGKGSTFKIYLPQVMEDTRISEAAPVRDEDLRGTETVLVVDDEEEVRSLVSEMLRFYGYKVMEAPNAGNALMIFEKYQDTIDIVLTDVVMPQMSGLDFVEKILPDYPSTKVLFMSGYTDNVIVEHGLLDKDRNFIQKPFNAKALIQKVREILDNFSA
jgi:two-component system cell cycle sensor histidine kinase/response regulator CckA